MENVGFDPLLGSTRSVHTAAYNHTIGTQKTASVTSRTRGRTSTSTRWSGTPTTSTSSWTARSTSASATRARAAARWPFDKPQYLLLNLAIGGSWGGQQGIDDVAASRTATWSTTCRIYRRAELELAPTRPRARMESAAPPRRAPDPRLPIYHQLGRVPRKRHVAFRKDDGALHYEELVGNQGFTGPSSLLYHLRLPTAVKSVRADPRPRLGGGAGARRAPPALPHLGPRRPGRAPCSTACRCSSTPTSRSRWRGRARRTTFFYRNAPGRRGRLRGGGRGRPRVARSASCAYRPATTSSIPRGVLHRWRLGPAAAPPPRDRERAATCARRSATATSTASSRRWRPSRERDIRRPERPRDPRRDGRVHGPGEERQPARRRWSMPHHPFDVVGWDGYYYPWAFSIHDFEPRVGPRAPAAAGAPDVRGRRLRDLLLLPAALRLRQGRGLGALQPPERDVGRGAVLRERRVHEPQGHRVRLDHAPPRRPAARPAARARPRSRSAPRARTSSRSWSTPSARCS